MTQPTEAVGGEAPVDAKADALKTFEDMAGSFFEEEQEEGPAEGDEPSDELEPEVAEDETPDEAEVDDLPPIDPPVSLSAEEKEVFKGLPREAQEFTARRIGELEKGFQTKAQEAARARTETEQAAIQQLAQIEQGYAQQYQQAAQHLEQLAQDPDYSLLATNPAEFARQAEVAKHYRAQFQQAQRAAEHYAQQAQQREAQVEQAYHAEQQKMIVELFPEYADPTTGPKIQQDLSAVARDMGYPPERIQQAEAVDILAMKTAAEWKADAEKYRALQKSKMEKVRSAKGLPRVAKPGVAVTADQTRQTRSDQAWDRAKAGRTIQDKAAGFADWAKSTGLV